MQDEHGATASSLVDTHGQAVGEGFSSRSGRRRGYSAHMIHPFCCVHLQSPLWEVFAGKSVRKNGMAPIIWYVVSGRQRGNVSRCSRKDTSTKERKRRSSRVPLCSVKRQRACFRKGSSRLVAAIAECLHTASIRRFSQLRRERGPCPRTRRVFQLRQAKCLACPLDTCRERPSDQQPCLHRRADPPWS